MYEKEREIRLSLGTWMGVIILTVLLMASIHGAGENVAKSSHCRETIVEVERK